PEPKTLQKWAKKALRQGDIAKIVCLAKNTVDNLRLLELVQENPGKMVAFGMGEEGKQSRIISLLYGAPFGFASLSKKSASGQIALDKMRAALAATANLVNA
ncbi:MAG: type I 3-dehydroquinate dehydratase, partial [Candidatus Micrarchaeota archaeon]|nr:type I 3-dehydroquinate dehydratase [Candidatus Micrarchaeota archaeon]